MQVILKPAAATPLTAFALAELGRRAGLPPGTLNILTGEAKIICAGTTAVSFDISKKCCLVALNGLSCALWHA